MHGQVTNVVEVIRGDLTKRQQRIIEARLTVTDTQGRSHSLWGDEGGSLYLPRGVLFNKEIGASWIGSEAFTDKRSTSPAEIPSTSWNPRPYQSKPISKMIKTGGGVLHAPTGSGKTVMMLFVAQALQQRTLVIVHTQDLLKQWQERVQEMFGIRCGTIGGGEWEEADITVATVQTLSNYDYPDEWFHSWGTVILDECHRCPAKSFTEIMSQMTAKYLFGATATPTRPDGMHPAMEAVIGPVVCSVKQQALTDSGQLVKPKVIMTATGWKSAHGQKMRFARNQFARNKIYQNLIHDLTADRKRAKTVAELVVENKDRSVLVLSSRIGHLEMISNEADKLDEIKSFIVTGQVDKESREAAIDMMRRGTLNVMYATQLADEGLDIPRLDTLILAYPRKSTEKVQQQIGRVMRIFDDKDGAIVYDLVDETIPTLARQAQTRMRFYKSKGYDITGWHPKLPKKPTRKK